MNLFFYFYEKIIGCQGNSLLLKKTLYVKYYISLYAKHFPYYNIHYFNIHQMPNNGNIIIISFWYSNQLKAYKQVLYTNFLLLKSVKISWLSKVSISQQVLTTMRHTIPKTLSTPTRSRMIQGDIEPFYSVKCETAKCATWRF